MNAGLSIPVVESTSHTYHFTTLHSVSFFAHSAILKIKIPDLYRIMSAPIRHDLNRLEDDYRLAFTRNDASALQRLQAAISTMRYELRMDNTLQIEYPNHDDEPLVMRILQNEKDLDRWLGQRFIRLAELS